MPHDRRDPALLWDMLAHAREVTELVEGKTFDDYTRDRLLRLAVERVIQIVGEAAFRTSSEFRAAHPELPWIPIIKQRHVLVHDYAIIDSEKIWRVATVYVPQLILLLEPIMPPIPPDPEPEPPDR